ncbi:AMP-binding protein [Streptomyces collinus]|uniref:amino acid adenylation domain-containing protein n=1 Tax=Streptomyces collinus TaxID=42684 RepID=UPI00364C76DB
MDVNELLRRAAHEHGPRTALIDGTTTVTYTRLFATVLSHAHALRARGLGPGTTVAVCVDRSPDTVALFLATQWIGAAYLPVDDRIPPARLTFMLADAGCDLLVLEDDHPDGAALRETDTPVLTRSGLHAAHPGGTTTEAQVPATPGPVAYVLYTSGSTGLPKAVPVSAANLSFFTDWLHDTYTPEEMAYAAFTISVGFDVSFAEILAPLVHGGALVLFEDLFRIGDSTVPLTSLANVPGNLARHLEHHTLPAGLKVVTSLGEPLRVELARRITAGRSLRLINAYGPTEATVYTTHHVVTPDDLDGTTTIPIGLPLPGVTAEVLAPDGTPCAADEPGELVVTGPNVTAGYLSAHARDSTAFFRRPGAAHPSYRTGDVVVRDASGVLTCLGRSDRQCKVNGIRVDLQEITTHLLACPGVANGHVAARETPAGTRLAAFVTATPEGTAHPEDIRAKLAAVLPRYSVPHDVLIVPALPTTMSGKIDEEALCTLLARPGADTDTAASAADSAADRIEDILARCTTAPDPASGHHRLHGLTSLELIALRRRLLHEHATDVPLREIYRCEDVAALADLVRRRRGNARPAPAGAPAEAPGTQACGVGEQNIWLADMLAPGSCGNNEVYRLTFTREISADRLERALGDCVRDLPALRTAYLLRGGQLVKEAADPAACAFRLGHVPADGPRGDAAATAVGRRPFDLADPLKMRAYLLPGRPTTLLLVIHHIAIDALAVDVLLEHLENLLLDRPAPPPRAAVGTWRAPAEPDALRAWWQQRLSPLQEGSAVPVPPGDTADRRELRLTGPAHAALLATTRKARTSVFGVLHAALTTVLARRLATGAVSLATPMTKRSDEDRQVACLTNVVPLVAGPRTSDTSVPAHLAELRHGLLETLDHSDVALSDLRTFQARPDAPLVHAMLAEVRRPAPGATLFEAVEVFTGIAKLPLIFLFEDRPDALHLVAEFVPGPQATAFVESVMAAVSGEIEAITAAVTEH